MEDVPERDVDPITPPSTPVHEPVEDVDPEAYPADMTPAGYVVCQECEAHSSWCDWPDTHTWETLR